MTISIVAGIVLGLTVPTKSQTSGAKYDMDEFPITGPVSKYMEQ